MGTGMEMGMNMGIRIGTRTTIQQCAFRSRRRGIGIGTGKCSRDGGDHGICDLTWDGDGDRDRDGEHEKESILQAQVSAEAWYSGKESDRRGVPGIGTCTGTGTRVASSSPFPPPSFNAQSLLLLPCPPLSRSLRYSTAEEEGPWRGCSMPSTG